MELYFLILRSIQEDDQRGDNLLALVLDNGDIRLSRTD